MTTSRRKPSKALTQLIASIDEDSLRRTRDRMLVACKIDEALKAKKISQKRFAEMVGRGESEISEWLSGNRNFTIDTLSDIENCLGITLLNIQEMSVKKVPQEIIVKKPGKKLSSVIYNREDSVCINNLGTAWQRHCTGELSLAI